MVFFSDFSFSVHLFVFSNKDFFSFSYPASLHLSADFNILLH